RSFRAARGTAWQARRRRAPRGLRRAGLPLEPGAPAGERGARAYARDGLAALQRGARAPRFPDGRRRAPRPRGRLPPRARVTYLLSKMPEKNLSISAFDSRSA